ncbi:hypothetical protein CPT03_09710 [Pedobacter ginsengisoli]|uniref:Uncharacterized protein n=1 Tax=Pedobacter ginsengisoli TaxID=363852 RepID=A0A2D1U533_9SPHI|nr:hypothetical protein CPT03_09710 [Pedobacter ginsengisoli]
MIYDQEVPSALLESAKIYHSRNVKNFPAQNGKAFIKLKPLWKDSWTVKSDGKNILVVPTIENRLENRAVSVRRVFLFTEGNHQIEDGKIVEFYGYDFDVEDNLNKLISNYQKKSINGFSGAIQQYDINYFFVRSSVFDRGSITDKKVEIVSNQNRKVIYSRRSAAIASADKKGGAVSYVDPNYQFKANCTYKITYDKYCVGSTCTVTITNIEELSCTEPVGTGSAGNGSGSGSSIGSASNGGGGGGGGGNYGGNTPLEVVNKILNQCLKNAVDLALNAKNTLRDMMNSLYGNTTFSDMKLVISEANTLANGDAGNAQFYPNISTDSITLNKTELLKRPKEYIVSTVYHEVIHSYMDIKNYKTSTGTYSPPTNHQEMVDGYLGILISALKSAFPNLSTHDAWALTWDGLKDTTMWNDFLTESERQDVDATLLKYHKDATNKLGTFCPL